MPGQDDGRAELLELLQRHAILHRSDDQPVLSRDGSPARWMLDSLAVTLTHRGAALAADALLAALGDFEGRQLATFGLTGVPLLQGCVLRGGGRYAGALVRKERKAHGSLKLVEGRLSTSEPVVMIDDSVSSGRSMLACARLLEEAGFHVEGGLCLVGFGYERGPARMVARGYRAAAVFDIFADFIQHMDGERPYRPNPTSYLGPISWDGRRAADGRHPAHVAREVIAEYLRTGRVLGAPDELDLPYDAAGGCWVSLRRRSGLHVRPARSGFWHFPEEPRGAAPRDVVLAAVAAAQQLGKGGGDPLRVLDDCAVAVTFFGELEECTVGDLDNDRYGIVARSAERPRQMGGALPRMPGIEGEWQQYVHAARRNARLLPLERHHLYRHRVQKVVEPGEAWQPSGVPARPGVRWPDDPAVVGPWARWARALVLHELGRGDPPAHAASWPEAAVGAFLTVYAGGRLVGCAGGFGDDCAARFPAFAAAAVRDRRFAGAAPGEAVAVGLSLLYGRHEMGAADPGWVVRPTRFADQALQVRQRDRSGFVLPFVAVTHNLTPRGYVLEVIDKAGITRPPYRWTRYDCTTWLADGSSVRPMRHGLPVGAPAGPAETQAEHLSGLLAGYARRHHTTSTEPYAARYDVFADRLHAGAHPARMAYGAWAKARAGLTAEALDDLGRPELRCRLDGWIGPDGAPVSIAEPAFVVLARIELGLADAETEAMARTLVAQIDRHGRFATHRDPAGSKDAFQDYAPGQALSALAAAARAGIVEVPETALAAALRHYRMRFRHNHAWGAVAWLTQAYAAWGSILDGGHTEFAFEIVDWATRFQSRRSGGFLNDHQRDAPGATTGLYLEALAVARTAARGHGDTARERRYDAACAGALTFLDSLVYQERDAAVLPNPEWAVGGIRTSATRSDVRIDFVHHALCGVLGLHEVAAVGGQG